MAMMIVIEVYEILYTSSVEELCCVQLGLFVGCTYEELSGSHLNS